LAAVPGDLPQGRIVLRLSQRRKIRPAMAGASER
jgi:hypothetical protein